MKTPYLGEPVWIECKELPCTYTRFLDPGVSRKDPMKQGLPILS